MYKIGLYILFEPKNEIEHSISRTLPNKGISFLRGPLIEFRIDEEIPCTNEKRGSWMQKSE